jgi:hypothetical protein
MSAEASAQDRMEVVASAFRASIEVYGQMGARLYAELCRHSADDPEMLALADQAMEGAKPSHLLTAVHYLLLRDPGDPLAAWFPTLSDRPKPPKSAFPELVRFCREHRQELVELLRTRSVQMTYAERCRSLLPAMCTVAREAGEPLNLVEIGCSAGVLLVFDKFAYRYDGGSVVGAPDAPFVLEGSLTDGPELFIPRIGKRTGIDLHTIDASSEDERLWLLGSCFPELRDEQARLAKALDVIAATPMTLLEGDGLARIGEALAATPDPLCLFHSACLMYWSPEARAELEALLLEEGRRRRFWRIGLEPSDRFNAWHNGHAPDEANPAPANRKTGEISIYRYEGGKVERRVAGYQNADFGIIQWCAQDTN